MKRLKQPEEENGRLKRIVADLSPDKEMAQALFLSDAAHWDVPDMTETLAQSYDLVEAAKIIAGQDG